MDRYTAAAIGNNIASIGDAFLTMMDPKARLAAASTRLEMEGQKAKNAGFLLENQWKPKVYQAQIGQYDAAATADKAHAGLLQSQTTGQDVKNVAGKALLRDVIRAPFTTYSTGAAVGGPDEMQDSWTNKGYTATGQNLTPGVVAVDPSVYSIGTVFKDPNSGETFVAADKHGNANPNVIDFYQPPGQYRAASGNRELQVVGHEPLKYGTTPEQIQAIRQRYSNEDAATLANVFAGGGAHDLMTGRAQAAGLSATTEEQARQALLGQGKAMAVNENFLPSRADAYQKADIAGQLDVARINQEGANMRKGAEIIAGAGGPLSVRGSSSGRAGVGRNPLDTPEGVKLTRAMSAERFGMSGEDGKTAVAADMQPDARAWEASVAALTESGVPIQRAFIIADQHHHVDSIQRVGDGWFDGSPRLKTSAGFNPVSITPQEAAAYAGQSGEGGFPAGNGAAAMFAAGLLNPQIASLAGAFQPVNAPADAQSVGANEIPPMIRRPDPSEMGPLKRKKATPIAQAQTELAAQEQSARDRDWNAGTLGNMMRAAQAVGVPLDDLIATAFAGTPENDAELERILTTSAQTPDGKPVIGPGGYRAEDIRNALRDRIAIQLANIAPERIAPYIPGQQKQTSQVGRFTVIQH